VEELKYVLHMALAWPSPRVYTTSNPSHQIQFLPGQWLDVYVPTIPQVGGFTITSPPSKALPSNPNNNGYAYLELAIQKSPLNPPAAWLWKPPPAILHSPLHIRVGGTFVFPPFPPNDKSKPLKKVIFIAGGVGINPLMSMLSSLAELSTQDIKNDIQVHFLYSSKDPDPNGPLHEKSTKILFLDRIVQLFSPQSQKISPVDSGGSNNITGKVKLFLTGTPNTTNSQDVADENESNKALLPHLSCLEGRVHIPYHKRRIGKEDVASALSQDQKDSAVYVCGVPTMTDEFVKLLTSSEESGGLGMDADRVLFEKWW